MQFILKKKKKKKLKKKRIFLVKSRTRDEDEVIVLEIGHGFQKDEHFFITFWSESRKGVVTSHYLIRALGFSVLVEIRCLG